MLVLLIKMMAMQRKLLVNTKINLAKIDYKKEKQVISRNLIELNKNIIVFHLKMFIKNKENKKIENFKEVNFLIQLRI